MSFYVNECEAVSKLAQGKPMRAYFKVGGDCLYKVMVDGEGGNPTLHCSFGGGVWEISNDTLNNLLEYRWADS